MTKVAKSKIEAWVKRFWAHFSELTRGQCSQLLIAGFRENRDCAVEDYGRNDC
jgi:hypothetical protein